MEGSSHWTHRVVQQTSRSQQEFSAWEHLGAHWTRAQCLHWPAAASCPRGVHTEFRETTSGSQSCLVPGSAQLLSCVFQCSKGHWEIDKLMLFELVAVADSCITPLIVCTMRCFGSPSHFRAVCFVKWKLHNSFNSIQTTGAAEKR